jgi:hypothetical protein
LSVAAGAGTASAAEPPRGPVTSPISVSPSDAALPAKSESPDGAKARVEAPKPHPEAGHRFEPPHGRLCFNPAETREKIATHRLAEPFRALRAGRLQGEALRARLCRWKPDEFVYEVSVLRPSGRVAHVYMNARSGQSVDALDDPDRN